MTLICAVCGRDIEPEQVISRRYCRRITAWELPPGTHQGGSSLVGRKASDDTVAHVPCAQGRVPTQAGMWQ